jgi:hypothetical protein
MTALTANRAGKIFSRLAPLAALLCVTAASLGIWLWERWFGAGGESFQGWMFFAVILFSAARVASSGEDFPQGAEELAASAFFLALYCYFERGGSPWIPRMARAAVLFSAAYWAIRASMPEADRRGSAALWILILMTLPYEPSLQFFCGYPLRRIAAILAAASLPGVEASGVALSDGVTEVFVDAPCAGAGMLSGMLLMSAGASLIFGLGFARSAATLALGGVCALLSNAFRAALLYAGHAGMIPFRFERYESATGLFCFALAGIFLLCAARLLARKKPMTDSREKIGAGNFCAAPENSHSDEVPWPRSGGKFARRALVALCAASFFILPARAAPVTEAARPASLVIWPTSWDGLLLSRAGADDATAQFARNFRGDFMEFSAVSEELAGEGYFPEVERVVMRFVRRATRELHPAEDCFEGAGYKISHAPMAVDARGRLWSRFTAEKSGRRVSVRQCVIYVPDGDLTKAEDSEKSWPDVSSWYWEASRSDDPVPTMAVTIVREL